MQIYELDVTENVLQELIHLSNNGIKSSMKDVSIIEEQDKIKQIISDLICTDGYHYGNLFNHSNPFTVHSDMSDIKKTVLLIPIKAHEKQKFIVFDQVLKNKKEMSWIYNIFDDKTDEELKEMYYHTASKLRPCESHQVHGCTHEPVSESLFKHLPYVRELYHGLTGFAWDYKPGKALLFPAERLHATGKMIEDKIGCTVQLTTPIEHLEIRASIHNQL